MSVKLKVVCGDSESHLFGQKALNYKYRIYTGPRCTGIESVKSYKNSDFAYFAGKRMIKKLNLT